MTHRPISAGRSAALHILRAPLLEPHAEPYVRLEEIDWAGLLAAAEQLPAPERLLVRMAYELSQATVTSGFWEISKRLDRASFRRVLEALTIAATGLPPATSPGVTDL